MTEITPYQERNVIQSYDDVLNVSKAMVASGYFTDSKSQSQAIVKILAGHEIGVGPFASMNGIHIIKGKPSFGSNLMASRVKASGKYNYRIVTMTESLYEIDFYELWNGKWEKIGTSSFSLADAKKIGTQNLDRMPRNMLFARAMSNGVRWFCPDIMNGSAVYTPEELGVEVDDDDAPVDVVEAAYTPVDDDVTPEFVVEPHKTEKKEATRPLHPEKLLDMLKRRAQTSNPSTLKQDTEIRKALQAYLLGDEELRHAVQTFLLDVPSLNSKEQPADPKRKMAVHNWLKPREVMTVDGETTLDIDDWAKQEIDEIVNQLPESDEPDPDVFDDSLPFD